MARKMDLKELASFEERLAEEDERDFKGNWDETLSMIDESHSEGRRFLLDNSYLLLLDGKIFKMPR